MRIAYIVDGRSDHVRRWVQFFIDRQDDVLVLSTYPIPLDMEGVTVKILPGIFRPGTVFANTADQAQTKKNSRIVEWVAHKGLDSFLRPLWHQICLFDVVPQALAVRRELHSFQPDIVHALRIQNEGYVAALAGMHPWVLSVWGNEFKYFSRKYRLHRFLTQVVLRFPDGLTADCARDIRISLETGLPPEVPTRLFPGNGGVDFTVFQPGCPAFKRERLIVYPRGIAPYLRWETLLQALKIMKTHQCFAEDMQVLLLMPPAVIPRAKKLIIKLGLLPTQVQVKPYLKPAELAALFQRAAIMVSPSISDGIPNSMLEAMACGAFPVMGDVDSIREWITPGENGLLVDPDDPAALAAALLIALDDVDLRTQAQKINYQQIQDRAVSTDIMPQVLAFYQQVISNQRGSSAGNKNR